MNLRVPLCYCNGGTCRRCAEPRRFIWAFRLASRPEGRFGSPSSPSEPPGSRSLIYYANLCDRVSRSLTYYAYLELHWFRSQTYRANLGVARRVVGRGAVDIMNAVGPDVATLGNHEVDYGVPHLLFLEKYADFPIINACSRGAGLIS